MSNWSLIYVFLADNEYGNELMTQIAKDTFNQFPNDPNLVVYVVEHAGWFLAFNRDLNIVGTANDSAILSHEAKRFLNKLQGNPNYLPEIRRNAA
jgi:hypothetical protein